jgi:hypothetical protein
MVQTPTVGYGFEDKELVAIVPVVIPIQNFPILTQRS